MAKMPQKLTITISRSTCETKAYQLHSRYQRCDGCCFEKVDSQDKLELVYRRSSSTGCRPGCLVVQGRCLMISLFVRTVAGNGKQKECKLFASIKTFFKFILHDVCVTMYATY